eukprot:PITA_12869
MIERARSMLSGVELGQEFWAEVVETTCYLVNRSPSLALEDKTPQEGYNLWNPVTRKVVYNQDVFFKEVKDVIKHEVPSKERKKIEFEIKRKNETLQQKRNQKMKSHKLWLTVKEAVTPEDEKLWKEAMVDEMASLHKNEAWDLVELLAKRKPISIKWVFKKKKNA